MTRCTSDRVRSSFDRSAFTLLELLAVVTIILILATLAVPSYKRIRQNAEKALCMANLRNLHMAFNSYTQDHQQWPQEPENLSREASEQWWMDSVKGYGAPAKVWLCPAFLRVHEEDPKRFHEIPKSHYVPTHFDEHQFTPFKWSTMPWVIEIGNFHGGGNLIIYPNGSIKGFGEVMETQAEGHDQKKGETGEVEVSVTAPLPTAEESSTPASAMFTFSRTGSTARPLEVPFKLTGSATRGSDYLDLPELITIPAGSAVFSLPVSPINNASEEDDEEVIATLEKGPYKHGGSPSAKIIIVDDDKKKPDKE